MKSMVKVFLIGVMLMLLLSSLVIIWYIVLSRRRQRVQRWEIIITLPNYRTLTISINIKDSHLDKTLYANNFRKLIEEEARKYAGQNQTELEISEEMLVASRANAGISGPFNHH